MPLRHHRSSPNYEINNSDFENSLMIFKKIQANLAASKATNDSYKLQFSKNSTLARSLKYKELKKILIMSERVKKLNTAKLAPRPQQQQPKANHTQSIHHNCDYVRDLSKFSSPKTQRRLQNEYVKSSGVVPSSSCRKSFRDREERLHLFDEKRTDSYNPCRLNMRSNFQHVTDQVRTCDLFKKHGQITFNQKKIRKKMRENTALLKRNMDQKKMSLLKSHFFYKSMEAKSADLLGTTDFDSIFTSVTTNDYQFTLDCMNTSYSSNYFRSDLTSFCDSEDETRVKTINKTSTRKCMNKKKLRDLNTSDGESQSGATNSSLLSSGSSTVTNNRVETLFDETDEPSFEFARADDDLDSNDQIKSHHDILNDIFNENDAEANDQQSLRDYSNPESNSDRAMSLILHRLPGKLI